MARLAYEFLGESPRNEKFARSVPGKKPFLKRKHKKITRIIKKLLTQFVASRPSPRRARLCVISGKIRAPVASLRAFSTFGSTPEASLARFQLSGAFPSLRWSVFKLREYSRCFAGAFSSFGSAPVASLERFQASGTLPRFRWGVFSLRERSQGLAGVFLCLGSTPKASL